MPSAAATTPPLGCPAQLDRRSRRSMLTLGMSRLKNRSSQEAPGSLGQTARRFRTRRRSFLISAVLTCGAGPMPQCLWASCPRLPEVGIETLSLEDFAARRRSCFTVKEENQPAARLVLMQVEQIRPRIQGSPGEGGAESETFSLRFEGRGQRHLAQEIYWLEHPELGRFALFLVPVGIPQGETVCYQAIINRLSASRPEAEGGPTGAVLT